MGLVRLAKKYWLVVACASLVATWIVLVETDFDPFYVDENTLLDYDQLAAFLLNDTVEYLDDETTTLDGGRWRNLTQEEISRLSVLGRRLFLEEETSSSRSRHADSNKTYKILIWKSGPLIERRLLYQYDSTKHDPFESCSVSNCELSYNESLLATADAVLIHLHRTRGVHSLPRSDARPRAQRWVFLTDESPHNTFLDRSAYNRLDNYDGIFNWSMTYRMDSDVPVPYGRTLHLPAAPRPPEDKTKMVAIMGSNCGGTNRRWSYYVAELQKHLQVDTYGGCGTLKCAGGFDTDCPLLNDYKFYLAFENSNCREYVSEKAWWNAYAKGAVPVVMGVSRADARKLLPPRSYIHTDEFDSPGDLARYLAYLDRHPDEYRRYFAWRRDYRVVNEHGYFKTPNYHYCRLCEALNYNDPAEKVYYRLDRFWNANRDCRLPGSTDLDDILAALYS